VFRLVALAMVLLVSSPMAGPPRDASPEESRVGALDHEAPSRAPVSTARVTVTSAPQPVRLPVELEAPLEVAERPSQRSTILTPPWRRPYLHRSDDPGDD
jgi:hypothetical protein